MDNQDKYEEIEPINDEQKKGLIRRASLGILLVVFLVFTGIIMFTGIINNLFGKNMEMLVLCIIAAFLVWLLYKSKKS
ncbi:hypothetical protein M2140_000640 [Clostridiales Family XIII bacterium PM5-7]